MKLLWFKIFSMWFIVNILLAIFIPIFFVLLFGIFIDIPNCYSIRLAWEMLMDKGVYMLLGITMILSVFQDYLDAKEKFTFIAWVPSMIVLFVTSFLFINSLDIIPSGKKFKENEDLFYFSLAASLLISILVKVRTTSTIVKKIKNNRHGL